MQLSEKGTFRKHRVLSRMRRATEWPKVIKRHWCVWKVILLRKHLRSWCRPYRGSLQCSDLAAELWDGIGLIAMGSGDENGKLGKPLAYFALILISPWKYVCLVTTPDGIFLVPAFMIRRTFVQVQRLNCDTVPVCGIPEHLELKTVSVYALEDLTRIEKKKRYCIQGKTSRRNSMLGIYHVIRLTSGQPGGLFLCIAMRTRFWYDSLTKLLNITVYEV